MIAQAPSELDATSGERAAAAVATAEFLLRLRARGIRNLAVLRALETVPRHMFVPHRYADLAARDVALPIGCGQTMPDPFFLAHLIDALALDPTHRVLEIGTGSGYVTAVLARLACEILSIERFHTLAIEARTRLEALRVDNAAVVWADGLRLPADAGAFDRIVVEALVDDLPRCWTDALAPEGIIVVARTVRSDKPGRPAQHLVRISRSPAGELAEEPIIASRLQPLIPGIAEGI
jgi:protein-L-isoaspartate(D-aspartate) O-methyltransferase